LPARIISASRRTDIPAAYADWFMARVREGKVHYPNRATGARVSLSLEPKDVIAFVFWTRNPAPLLPHLGELDSRYGSRHLMHLTVTDLPRSLELRAPPLDLVFRSLEELSTKYGIDHVTWRFDPILVSRENPVEEVLARFSRLAKRMNGLVERCVFSFIDPYLKTTRNLASSGVAGIDPRYQSGDRSPVAIALKRELVVEMASLARPHGIRLQTCCEDELVEEGFAERGACIDAAHIRTVLTARGILEGGPRIKEAPTRPECGCSEARDIGTYDSCPHGCVYCYANRRPDLALANYHRFKSEGFPMDKEPPGPI
jgi:hypothetical protein